MGYLKFWNLDLFISFKYNNKGCWSENVHQENPKYEMS